MWSVVLKILSILGIILLCLLALVLVTLLLVLFWPVSYRGGGNAREGEYRCWFRFRWLFGLVRGAYMYPESGGLQVKVLWLTVYDSAEKRQKALSEEESSGQDEEEKAQSGRSEVKAEEQSRSEPVEGMPDEGKVASFETPTNSEEQGQKSPKQSVADRAQALSEKLSGLKEKVQFYVGIVQDENNQGLVKHGLVRLGKVLKSIRPRFLRAEALIGLKEPELTGYVYGIYWAIKPFLGKKCYVVVTPDFERQVLEGEFTLGGRIMAVVLLHHVIRVLLDKRLRLLLDKMKNR